MRSCASHSLRCTRAFGIRARPSFITLAPIPNMPPGDGGFSTPIPPRGPRCPSYSVKTASRPGSWLSASSRRSIVPRQADRSSPRGMDSRFRLSSGILRPYSAWVRSTISRRMSCSRSPRASPTEVRGRVSRTRAGRIGRYGWKAQIPTLHEFVRAACANELGLEVPGHSQPPSPLDPTSKAEEFDLKQDECDALVAYMRSLPAPVAVDLSGPQGTNDMLAGRVLFTELECTACHKPTLGNVQGIYSDLLLHNMGQSLSDGGGSYGIDSSDSPEAHNGPRMAHAPSLGVPRLGPLHARRPSPESGRSRGAA